VAILGRFGDSLDSRERLALPLRVKPLTREIGMHNIDVNIAAREARARIIGMPPETTIEDRLRTAMEFTRDHWLCTSDDGRITSAVVAVMLTYPEWSEERDRLTREMKALQQLAQGDVTALLSFEGEPVGILNIWDEITGKEATK